MTQEASAVPIVIIHLDLGIGGAEQLMVNIACCLKQSGHPIRILTSHHSHDHCFEETKPSGILGKDVVVYGDWLPRHIYGKGTAFCAIIRMIYLSIVAATLYRNFGANSSDMKRVKLVVIIDGVSAPIPILHWAGLKTIFYCHFPDMLLCTDRQSIFKRLYRFIIDSIEEVTTGCADMILVNSEFTASVFQKTFKTLGALCKPSVLYPVIQIPSDSESDRDGNKEHKTNCGLIDYTEGYDFVFLSLNRYERKKYIELAILSAKKLQQLLLSTSSKRTIPGSSILIVIAGGYDVAVRENVEYLQELVKCCQSNKLPYTAPDSKRILAPNSRHSNPFSIEIMFRVSISSAERTALLNKATGLLYTPDREHFGIVPLEAMYQQCPVIAVNSGGPKETILHGLTGYLCPQTPEGFAQAMYSLLINKKERLEIGLAAKKHVKNRFTTSIMKERLKKYLSEVVQSRGVRVISYNFLALLVVVSAVALIIGCSYATVLAVKQR